MEWGISFLDLNEEAQDAFISAICEETDLEYAEVNSMLYQEANAGVLLGSIHWVMPYN